MIRIIMLMQVFYLFGFNAHFQENDLERLFGAENLTPLEKEMLENKYVGFQWVDQISFIKKEIVSDIPLAKYPIVEMLCGEELTPLHKLQKNKLYHVIYTVRFKHSIPGTSKFCQIPRKLAPECQKKQREKLGLSLKECRDKYLKCIVPGTLKVKLLSDSYRDSCDQEMRAFTLVHFLLPEEIQDSLSPGHTIQKEAIDGSFHKDVKSFIPGPTYTVPIGKFIYFSQKI